jgi:hypothetical protein
MVLVSWIGGYIVALFVIASVVAVAVTSNSPEAQVRKEALAMGDYAKADAAYREMKRKETSVGVLVIACAIPLTVVGCAVVIL